MAAKGFPTKTDFLGINKQKKDLEFKFQPLDSPGVSGQAVFTGDDGNLMFRDMRLNSEKDVIDFVTRMCIWYGVAKADLVDLP